MKNVFSIIFVIFLLLGCGGPQRDPEPADETVPTVYTRDNLEPCILKELNYHTNVDIDKYSPIEYMYFSEIEDYTHSKAQDLQSQIWHKQAYIREYLTIDYYNGKQEIDSLQHQELQMLRHDIDSLQTALRPYREEVVGYVFVHTFASGDDTLAVIFVMDTECQRTEAIGISNPTTGLDPDDYRERLSNITIR